MIRSAFALLLLITPAAAEVLTFEKGDVVCVLFDASDKTCLTKGLILNVTPTRISYSEEMHLSDYDPDLALTTFSQLDLKDEQYCLVPGTIRSVALPEMTPAAQFLVMIVNDMSENAARTGLCIEHKRCGDQVHSIAYFGGLRDPANDSTYTLFHADNPVIQKLAVRPVSFKDLSDQVDEEAVKCEPTT